MRLVPLVVLLLVLPVAANAMPQAPDPVEPLEAPASDAPWARELVRTLPRATAVNDGDGNKLFDDLDARFAAAPGTPQEVIVLFRHDVATADGLAAARGAAGDFPVQRTFTLVPAASVELTPDQALRVAALDEVRQLEWNRPGTAELDTATVFFGADHVVDDLNVTGDRDGAERTWTPRDVTIAILDTGFDGEHEDLDEGKIIHFEDLGDGKSEAYDSGSHGTHVASIAAGTGDGDAAYRGVAPGAAVVGLKIVDVGEQPFPLSWMEETQSAYDLAIAGYEWIVEHKDAYGIDVSTMSFGFGYATDGTTTLELAVDAAWEAGIVNFKSTGNSGSGRSTMTVPAAARGIIAVGALLDPAGTGGGTFGLPNTEAVSPPAYGMSLAPWSSRGPTTDGRIKPDVTAPGYSITAAYAGTGDGYAAFSGTSMASPFTAGTTALVLDANPALAPDDVRDVLLMTAEDWSTEGPDVDYGWGRLQVASAVAEAFRRAGEIPAAVESPVVPFHATRAGTIAMNGQIEVPVEVNDTTHPLSATILHEGGLTGALVLAPDGRTVADAAVGDPTARQHHVSFDATETGTYRLRLLGTPGTPFVADLSYGSAGGLPLVGDLLDPLDVADDPTVNPVPAAGWLAAVVVALAGVVTRRR